MNPVTTPSPAPKAAAGGWRPQGLKLSSPLQLLSGLQFGKLLEPLSARRNEQDPAAGPPPGPPGYALSVGLRTNNFSICGGGGGSSRSSSGSSGNSAMLAQINKEATA
ncbi:unnamed protein product [Amoebophrya sp. A25]|nr:unnamed protein product [Amoebophrya sp. A25]|eukprot:GSA25T00015903001.1